MEKRRILWVDDEIELLRPHIIFLSERGYSVTPVTNGEDAIYLIKEQPFDIVLLDEMMPGRDGLSALSMIKQVNPNLPVVMITKREEEELMEEAIGKKATDFLTKPVNPSQILSVCKRILDAKQIRAERIAQEYVSASNRIRSALSGPMDWRDWIEVHIKLSQWDIEMEEFQDTGLWQMHRDQKRECNVQFGKYIEKYYPMWVKGKNPPPLSVDVVSEFLYPPLVSGLKTLFIIIDCMRLDQWLSVEPLLAEFFTIRREHYYSILPTATPYSRNAIFSGLFPREIAKRYPEIWGAESDDEQSLNRYEHRLLDDQLKKMRLHPKSTKYIKVFEPSETESLLKKAASFASNRSTALVSIVFNFIDLLTHGRSKSDILHQIAPDEAAFRSLTKSWFSHSALFEMLRKIAQTNVVVVITSDHGSILGKRATVARGDRRTSVSLRYKYGNNLGCDPKEALLIRNPADFELPSFGMRTNFIISKEDYFFVYPIGFHEYERRYRNSFQHGGISLEEMILPVAVMRPK